LSGDWFYECVEPDWVVHVLQTPTDSAFVNGGLRGLQNEWQSRGRAGIDDNWECVELEKLIDLKTDSMALVLSK